MRFTCFKTRFGWIGILADARVISYVTLPRSGRRAALADLPLERTKAAPGENRLLRLARARLERYFSGKATRFDDLPIDDSGGTPFQREVWKLTRTIPYGSTWTYGELALAVGRPRAARAIGQCMARNRFPIIVPCHRVLGSTGNLRGFGAGVEMKRALLKMEGVF